MKKCITLLFTVLMVFSGIAQAEAASSDATLEMILVLKFADDLGIEDYELMDVLQGYKEYRSMMDGYVQQRAEKQAALADAVAKNESGTVVMGLTRDLMNIDMNILRLKQSSVNEASSILGATAVAQLYLLVGNLEQAKADLLAELTGTSKPATCPMAAAAAAAGAAPVAEAPAAADPAPEVKPETAILEQAMVFLNKMVAKELDAAMEGVSANFEHNEYGNKEELKAFLNEAIQMGYLDEMKILTEDTEVKIEGEKAIIYPIDLEGLFGSFTLELTCQKEGDKWMLVAMDIFGI